jgi:peptide/nickel transport system substrate-binding protein
LIHIFVLKSQISNLKSNAEVSDILHGEAVRLAIVHSQPLLGKRKNIQGWIPSPLGSEPFEEISKN